MVPISRTGDLLKGSPAIPAVFFHVLLPFCLIILGAKLYLNHLSEFWGTTSVTSLLGKNFVLKCLSRDRIVCHLHRF